MKLFVAMYVGYLNAPHMVHACIVDAENPVSDSNAALPELRKIRSSNPTKLRPG
jgi:hypothetical protein